MVETVLVYWQIRRRSPAFHAAERAAVGHLGVVRRLQREARVRIGRAGLLSGVHWPPDERSAFGVFLAFSTAVSEARGIRRRQVATCCTFRAKTDSPGTNRS